MDIKKILVPTDFSEYSDMSLVVSKELAKKFTAKVTILHVVEDTNYIRGFLPPTLTLIDNIYERLLEEAKKRLSEQVRELKEDGVDADYIVTKGIPSILIASIAEEDDFDLVVIPSHGRTALEKFVMGSTCLKVARKIKKPLLIIPVDVEEEKKKE